MRTLDSIQAAKDAAISVLGRGPLCLSDLMMGLKHEVAKSSSLRSLRRDTSVGASALRQLLVNGEDPIVCKTNDGEYVLRPDHPYVRERVAVDILDRWRGLLPERGDDQTEELDDPSEESSIDDEDTQGTPKPPRRREPIHSEAERQRLKAFNALRDVIVCLQFGRLQGVQWFDQPVFPFRLYALLHPELGFPTALSPSHVLQGLRKDRVIRVATASGKLAKGDPWNAYVLTNVARYESRYPDLLTKPDPVCGLALLRRCFADQDDAAIAQELVRWRELLSQKTGYPIPVASECKDIDQDHIEHQPERVENDMARKTNAGSDLLALLADLSPEMLGTVMDLMNFRKRQQLLEGERVELERRIQRIDADAQSVDEEIAQLQQQIAAAKGRKNQLERDRRDVHNRQLQLSEEVPAAQLTVESLEECIREGRPAPI